MSKKNNLPDLIYIGHHGGGGVVTSHPDLDHAMGFSSFMGPVAKSPILIEIKATKILLAGDAQVADGAEQAAKTRRRRKADLYVMKWTRWLSGSYAEEAQRDLQDRVERWRSEGMPEGQICRQVRYELLMMLLGTICRIAYRSVPEIIKTLFRS